MSISIGGFPPIALSNTEATPLFTRESSFVNVLTKTYPVTAASQSLTTALAIPVAGGVAVALTAPEVTLINSAKKVTYQYLAVGNEKFYIDTDGNPVTVTDGQSTNLVGNEIIGQQNIANTRFMASAAGGNLVVMYYV